VDNYADMLTHVTAVGPVVCDLIFAMREFEVTQECHRCYRPAEHIDNPNVCQESS